MFEAFARLVRRVSSSTLCSGGAWRKFSQSANAWTSFCGWWPKRRYFSSSKMRIPARSMANQRASSKPPARETLVKAIRPAVEATVNDDLEATVEANVKNVVQALRSSTPILKPKIDSAEVKVIGGYYSLDTGAVTFLAEK
jgi:hypothetical protein